jgi:prepilin-type N-terminal cleavage/methylation domain-containing protein
MIRKNNKNGFTLVELLAVIVILAVILAIAVPGISGLIDNSKRSAFEADAKMILTGLEYQQLQTTVGTAQITITDNLTLTTDNLSTLGANSANYTTVRIIELSPLKICVETPSTSKFGAQNVTATKSNISDHTGVCLTENGAA